MELNLSLPIHLKQGLAEISFPEGYTRDPYKTTIRLDSLCLPVNRQAHKEGLFVVCNASFYRGKNQQQEKNVLGLFANMPSGGLENFGNTKFPLTMPQENIQIECVDFHGVRQDVAALGVVQLCGPVRNKLLAI